MSDHYFSNKPSVTSNPKNWDFTLKGHNLHFTSDSGVFSKNEVDFGSRLLIEEFMLPSITGPILDVGCGYGPIGLSLAKAFEGRIVEMVDVNERALDLARKNAEKNRIENVKIYPSDIFSNVKTNNFASILSNPPIRAGKKVVHQILEESYHHLADRGELWVVIQKKQGAPSAVEKLKSIFEKVEIVEKKKGYFIIKSTKIIE